MADEIGAVESGKLAGLIAHDTGPMADILAVQSVYLVSKAGQFS
jgi:imidazolonepropionase-like amidohydrolase